MLPWVAHPNVVHFDVRACPERSRKGGNHNYLHNGEENERDHAGTKSDRYFPLQHCTATWLTLNDFRVQYYNDSVEGPSPQTSPYLDDNPRSEHSALANRVRRIVRSGAAAGHRYSLRGTGDCEPWHSQALTVAKSPFHSLNRTATTAHKPAASTTPEILQQQPPQYGRSSRPLFRTAKVEHGGIVARRSNKTPIGGRGKSQLTSFRSSV